MLNYIFVLFRLALAIGLFCQAGLLALVVIRPQAMSWVEKASLAFGLGVGLITIEMLAFSLVGLPLLLWALCAPWALGWAVVSIRLIRQQGFATASWHARWTNRMAGVRLQFQPLDCLLLAVLSLISLLVIFRGTFYPVFEWDGWAIWDLKARAFYYDRSIFPFVNDSYYALSHLDYPLLYPLAGTFVYLVLGQVVDGVTVLPAVFYTATLGIFYAGLRRYGSQRVLALALTLGLAFQPSFLFWSQQFYAETPFLFYVLAGSLFLFFYFREPEWRWLVLSGMLSGFATQTKVEGILLAAAPLLAVVVRAVLAKAEGRQAWKAAGVYALTLAVAYLPWSMFRQVLHPLAEGSMWSEGQTVLQRLSSLTTVLVTLVKWATQPAYQYLFFLVYPVTLLLIACNWKRYLRQGAFAFQLINCLMLLVPTTLLFVAEPQWLISERIGRYLVVFSGVGYLLLALHTVDLFRGVPGLKWRQPSFWSTWTQRAAVGAMMMFIAGDLAADLWRQPGSTAPFTSRPIGMVRQVWGEATEMLGLNSAERQQAVNNHFKLQEYGALIQLALATTPPNENVALWLRPENAFDYLWRKGDYWLYPRKIVVVRDMSFATVDRLHAAGVGTLIVYGEDPPWEAPGFLIYHPSPAFAVMRLNFSEPSASHVPGYAAAPVNLENGIRLDGYQIVPPLLNGDTIILLRWQTARPVTQSYTVFVHIISGDNLAAQDDSTPVMGQLPTFLWKPGDTILDAHRVVLPRDQRQSTTFCIGMYDSATLQRLPVQQANGYQIGTGIVCRPFNP